MICLDTHALVWLALSPDKLSVKVQQLIAKESEFLISDISIWEITTLVSKTRLVLPIQPIEFFELLLNSRNFIVSPISPSIAQISTSLLMHKDPADRLICSTALFYNTKLVTKDKEIIKSKVVDTIW